MKIPITIFALLILTLAQCSEPVAESPHWAGKVKVVLDNTKPLEYERGNRLPLYLWPAVDPAKLDEKSAELLVKEFDKRGIGIVSSWGQKDIDRNIEQAIIIAKAQKKLGQRININVTSLLYGFFNGNEKTAHIDNNGKAFFDDSFGKNHQMGCPFAIDQQKGKIRDRLEYFLKKYKEEGLTVDFIFADWEIDGPIEVNGAFESSKKCVRCKKYLGENFCFDEFQKIMREMRSYLQSHTFSSPVLSYFPNALVGNYAVYPNDGYRYWYDYFESYNDIHPGKTDQKATYRKWYNDFPLTGYTFAMPVVYPWSEIFTWYDFKNIDYRWFYNMLLVASNAGKNTPQNVPIVSFIHWHTVLTDKTSDKTVTQMSEESYQELLWHMLLRGTDTFFMWSSETEFPEETRLVHEVYAASQKYGKFIEHGVPITYDVPDKPGTVISGLAMNDSVLIRRTDFGSVHNPVQILAGTKLITVKYAPGVCKVVAL